MAIYDPSPFLTKADKELLRLLAQLIVEQEDHTWTPNRDRDFSELTGREALELLELIEQFIDSKRFIESSYLVEKVFGGATYDDRALRNIYLGWRRFHGKSRALASVQWQNVLARLGAIGVSRGDAQYWYRAGAEPMSLDHFYKMESRLADALGMSPRVKSLILGYVRLQFGYIDRIRSGSNHLEEGQISKKPKEIFSSLKSGVSREFGTTPIATSKIAAVMIIVMDIGSLYTTRDWSVAGFLSTIAGAAPPALLD